VGRGFRLFGMLDCLPYFPETPVLKGYDCGVRKIELVLEGEIYRSSGAAISGGGEASAEIVGSVAAQCDDEGAVDRGIESCAIVIECQNQPWCS